ncbi:hypothetical protein D3C75_1089640 [compost metagenome]
MASEHRLLHHELAVSILKHDAANRRILPFSVLPHDYVVDVARLTVCQWARYAREKAHGANVHILIKFSTESQE